MLALRRPLEIEDRLKALARRTGRSKDDQARDAILEHLENLKAAEQHPAAVRSGESDTVPLEDLLARYGVADCVRAFRGTRTRQARP
ncbi:hypothetical protein ASF60_03505 [Methylobacterium sp. Leaf113]|uniref:type II toxin-antitoxin system RelB family antitoxin n=1 Tax=Methylobacterium sp. Leaf113 TaxID=1736259 RepID=UPI0006F3F98D|nr:hypothetical protein [Methylobacterium sp. Leaf113]KQP90907.1 hypothetical protein ASF60_03505 [Methylobacterium sp. Leaf113]